MTEQSDTASASNTDPRENSKNMETECSECENHECTCEDEGDDEEEVAVELDLTHGEAITLLHTCWDQQLEYGQDQVTSGLAVMLGEVENKLAQEIYSDAFCDWIQDRRDKREEMMESYEDMMEQMNADGDGPDLGRTFQ
jgi:hypothetical protein